VPSISLFKNILWGEKKNNKKNNTHSGAMANAGDTAYLDVLSSIAAAINLRQWGQVQPRLVSANPKPSR